MNADEGLLGILEGVPDLVGELRELLRQVPTGRVTMYGELARALGDVRAARWIGEFLVREHGHTTDCPCHRVVRSTGEIGLYVSGNEREKASRLRAEGVAVRNGHVDTRTALRAAEFVSSSPLTRLSAFQDEVGRRVRMSLLTESPEFLCGLDVAYAEDGTAVGAAVVLSVDRLDLVREFTCRRPAAFPYIPGYLAFRELPVLLDLWTQIASKFPSGVLCFVDGNGRLHPRRAGIASCFGLLADVPTIGIGKSLLCGRVTPPTGERANPAVQPGDIVLGDEVIGRAVRPDDSTGPPVYASVGHRLTLDEVAAWTKEVWRSRRLPEPIWLADRLSKRTRA